MVQAKKLEVILNSSISLIPAVYSGVSSFIDLLSLIFWSLLSFFPPIYLLRHWPYLDSHLLLPELDLPLTKFSLQISSCGNHWGFSEVEIWTSLIKSLHIGYRKNKTKQKSSEVLGTELQVSIIWFLPFELRR